jgi:threonine/homoserine/homoserine lactone efflux protein
MSIETFTALAVFSLVASITPGPNTTLVLASGVNHGFRATVPLLCGICVGLLVMLFAVGLGLGQAFVVFPMLYTLLKVFSIAYLLWLAWKIATAEPVVPGSEETAPRAMSFVQGAGFQWVNPKAWTMCLTVAAGYTVPENYTVSLALAALVFATVNIPSITVWALFGASVRQILTNPRAVRNLNIAMALALVASLWPLVQALVAAARPAG